MAKADSNNEAIKRSSREALAVTLRGQRELSHQVFAEVLEDFLKGRA